MSYVDPQNVLDDIDRSFQLTQEALVELAKSFLHEFALGLENYGQPMAMMSVVFLKFSSRSLTVDYSSPTFVTGVPNGTETGQVSDQSFRFIYSS